MAACQVASAKRASSVRIAGWEKSVSNGTRKQQASITSSASETHRVLPSIFATVSRSMSHPLRWHSAQAPAETSLALCAGVELAARRCSWICVSSTVPEWALDAICSPVIHRARLSTALPYLARPASGVRTRAFGSKWGFPVSHAQQRVAK